MLRAKPPMAVIAGSFASRNLVSNRATTSASVAIGAHSTWARTTTTSNSGFARHGCAMAISSPSSVVTIRGQVNPDLDPIGTTGLETAFVAATLPSRCRSPITGLDRPQPKARSEAHAGARRERGSRASATSRTGNALAREGKIPPRRRRTAARAQTEALQRAAPYGQRGPCDNDGH